MYVLWYSREKALLELQLGPGLTSTSVFKEVLRKYIIFLSLTKWPVESGMVNCFVALLAVCLTFYTSNNETNIKSKALLLRKRYLGK